MTFKMVPVKTIKQVVKIKIPKDHGKHDLADFEVEMKKLPVSEVRDLLKRNETDEVSDFEALSPNIVDIKGIKGEDGADIQYTNDILEQLLDMEYVKKPLLKTFFQIQLGKEEFRQKN